MKNSRSVKLYLFGQQIAFWLILIGFGVLAWWFGGVDFRGYYAAAVAVRSGANPYDYTNLAPILETLTGYVGNNPYYYPPYYVLLFVPLTFLEFQWARAVWLFVNLLLFYIALTVSVKLIGYQSHNKWIMYILLLIGLGVSCLRSEQSGIVLLLGLGLSLWAIIEKKGPWVAVGLSLLLVKPQVTFLAAIAIGIWLLRHFRQGLAYTIIWLVLLMGIATLAIPGWYSGHTGLSGLWQTNEGYQRVNATLYDYLLFQHNLAEGNQWPIVVVVVGVTLVALWLTRNELGPFVLIAFAGGLSLTPYALQYDYVPLVIAVLWVFKEAQQGAHKVVVVSLLALGLTVLIWQEWSYQGYLQVVFIYAALLFAVATKFLWLPSGHTLAE